VVPKLIELPQPLASWSDRYVVNRNVSPDESDRCSGTIVVLGRFTLRLSFVIAESFHLVILPW
jgi:hypothetical protein